MCNRIRFFAPLAVESSSKSFLMNPLLLSPKPLLFHKMVPLHNKHNSMPTILSGLYSVCSRTCSQIRIRMEASCFLHHHLKALNLNMPTSPSNLTLLRQMRKPSEQDNRCLAIPNPHSFNSVNLPSSTSLLKLDRTPLFLHLDFLWTIVCLITQKRTLTMHLMQITRPFRWTDDAATDGRLCVRRRHAEYPR